ncbi:pantoate--beta-alanine ligase [Evansella caseinilytica]|uniref:Pantothenate synthetase n=1 Tax=Evansella caseinilytica TaxID=1503961 RepID=A0A1H3NIH1_9BACI|nr:pantoate--beta-alanine ligase [Evansella caseinilytica]SDY88235.1 pantoate--beta-alanine ligase [Evansella caseinilytica]
MEAIKTIQAIKSLVKQQKATGKSIGFVPTMGFLHEGHLSLIKQAKLENDFVVVSIFVNPLQFGEGEDYDRYPRDVEKDNMLLQSLGVDVLFHPEVSEMYPGKLSAQIVVREGVNVLCGAKRPGHFDGVATVVMKLFQIVLPDKAYFGLKDAQQVAVIERLVKDYHLDVEIIRGRTVREEDGLAKSSRNVYLTERERKEAPAIYQALLKTKEKLLQDSTKTGSEIESFLNELLTVRLSGKVDYAEVRSFPDLKKLTSLEGEIIIAAAVNYSKARLIDNVIVQLPTGDAPREE